MLTFISPDGQHDCYEVKEVSMGKFVAFQDGYPVSCGDHATAAAAQKSAEDWFNALYDDRKARRSL